MSDLLITPKVLAPLDASVQPSLLWNLGFQRRVASDPASREVVIGIAIGDRVVARLETLVHGKDSPGASENFRFIERLVKSLLWIHGGSHVLIGGADELAEQMARHYTVGGERAFDADMLGRQIYLEDFRVESCAADEVPAYSEGTDEAIGRHTEGCRIGFDLGGSDRKAAAVIDGEVVFSEEIGWDPYFQSDPTYHFDGIVDSIKRAAAHLPRVDAVGGSAAGVYVSNEVRAASLFRGVSASDFETKVRRIFHEVMASLGWADTPWRVVNDGEVTALAGSMSIGGNNLLGLSMGTSFAAGYINAEGNISSGLNELAFVPVDYRLDGPLDEWSGDRGCGVQFFSQQAVARLATEAGIPFETDVPFPERLVEVQRLMDAEDPRARAIYSTIGINFGYTIAFFSQLYQLEHLLILGRVTSGAGGELILAKAREVLDSQFPKISKAVSFHIPDEKEKRHGQAVAAASLASRAVRS